MLAMSVRVSPWSALCRVSSEGRRTTTAASSRAMASSGWIVRPISPLGPFTVIRCPSIWTVTPLGSGTGFLPMRDMGRCLLPHHREQLAADTGGASFAVGHQSLRGRQDRHPQAVLDARDLARLDVAPEASRGDALQLANHRRVVEVLKVQPQQPLPAIVQPPPPPPPPTPPHPPRAFDLQSRHRHVHPPVPRPAGLPH